MPQIQTPIPAVNLGRLLLDARMKVCEALVSGGPEAALAAVGAQSIRLYRYVMAGDLVAAAAFRALLQVSVNLRLVHRFGKAAIRAALYAGPRFYADMAEAA